MGELYIINLTVQYGYDIAAYPKRKYKILYCCYVTSLPNSELKIYIKPYFYRHLKKNLGKSSVNHLIQEITKDSGYTILHDSINYVKIVELIQDYLGIFPDNSINCIYIREIKIR